MVLGMLKRLSLKLGLLTLGLNILGLNVLILNIFLLSLTFEIISDAFRLSFPVCLLTSFGVWAILRLGGSAVGMLSLSQAVVDRCLVTRLCSTGLLVVVPLLSPGSGPGVGSGPGTGFVMGVGGTGSIHNDCRLHLCVHGMTIVMTGN